MTSPAKTLYRKEHPILFSGPMIRAILAGKTQTRRLVTRATSDCGSARWEQLDLARATPQRGGSKLMAPLTAAACLAYGDDSTMHRVYPRWQAKERLWVRESFCPDWTDHVIYRADGGSAREAGYDREPRWSPSIYMPRHLSRITLEVVSVRVERLQDITSDDIRAEGINEKTIADLLGKSAIVDTPLRDMWRIGWDKINGKRAPWAENPFVWCISFKRQL